MNILIDGQTLESAEINRGIGTYFKNVVNEMIKGSYEHTWYITVKNASAIEFLDPWVAKRINPITDPTFLPCSDYSRTKEFTKMVRKLVTLHNIDVFWIPNPLMVNVSFINESVGCPVYITIHDLIPAILPPDWSSEVRDEYESRLKTISSMPDMHIICISESTDNDVKKYINMHLDTKIIFEAANRELLYAENTQEGTKTTPYVMFVGGFDYRKNINGALEAFAKAIKRYPNNKILQEAKFLFVCSYDEESKKEFIGKCRRLNILDRVELMGFVAEEKLAELYAHADVFFFPSLYEGFGLPVLEAMLSGAYVLCADNSSLPEVCGGHALLCNASNTNDMAKKLSQAFYNASAETSEEKQRRQEYALSFSWQKAAAETLSFFKSRSSRPLQLNHRLKIAIATPWPKQRTGIANYIYRLMPFLTQYFDVDIFVDSTTDEHADILNNPWGGLFPLHELDKRHNQYNQVLYELGNNSNYHLGIYQMALKYPGIGEIHDFALHHMFYHASKISKYNSDLYRDTLVIGYGMNGLQHYKEVAYKNISPDAEAFPVAHSVCKICNSVIVHNAWSKEQLKECDNVKIIPHPSFALDYVAKKRESEKLLKLKYATKEDTVIACFGFINYNKRPQQILSAVKRLIIKGYQIKVIFFGQLNYEELNGFINSNQLDDVVHITGYLEREEYEIGMQMCDLVVNLRYPSVGESSGVMCEALQLGKPLLVSDLNQYNEFPDDVCWKVPIGKHEIDILENMIENLILNEDVRKKIGNNAKEYARSVLDPNRIAELYYEAIIDAIGSEE